MEPFIVSARKYRPQTFKNVVGQQAITETLLNAIEHNHLAQALLFCGPRGVGKTTCARILAKKINEDGTERQDEDYAFNIFELDAASNNSVDDIRSLIDQVRIPPQVGKYKVYIIDEVHMLSQSAFNAFLKTLEEPPKHAIFILATTEKHKIIPTILSRCQIFDFKRITVKDAASYLKYIADEQGIEADDDALHIIAQKADGAMRDALSIFDRVVSFSGKKLDRKAVTENLNVLDLDTFFDTTDLILTHDIPGLLMLFNKTLAQGFEGQHFISGLATHFRDLMVCRHEQTITLLEVGENAQARYLEQSKKTSESFLLQAIDIANDCSLKYKSSKNHRLLVELTLMKLASIDFHPEKKNPDVSSSPGSANLPSLVPASYFKGQSPIKVREKDVVVTTEPLDEKPETEPITEEAPGTQKPDATPTPVAVKVSEPAPAPTETAEAVSRKINIKDRAERVSGLSISSIKVKKAHAEKASIPVDEASLPKEDFTEEAMQHLWKLFVDQLNEKGKRILATNLNVDTPKLIDQSTIHIEMPNSTMKKEIEREQGDLLMYLRQELENYDISLKITVNETTSTKYAFTPEEKYQKLREKNPAIDLLRQEFDLDI
ncbi:DNA polymerase III subunit gamma/tau [Zeaxanthinibacter enoshimensis]|uniref:DNA polymerase III subunit gamma/tau n=1 Tax=Zeaxanthinibacter enoshimensis TaxID=392009 RepID=A0A4R6TMQ8_9FLAO|nr:DNA polymerase III subunit gamma/tau [Zeaxanthinibacter enoshimensis]TDQ31019.1 DNA polymerase-3 subunit gamma/tau [Zeaxanthinibacter enoshimensis]